MNDSTEVTSLSADTLMIAARPDTAPEVVALKDYIVPYGEPLFPLTAHLTVEPSALAAGSLPDYDVRNDNVMTLVLIATFVMLVVAVGRSGRFLLRQAKAFFVGGDTYDAVSITSGERMLQFFLLFISSLLLALSLYLSFTEDKMTVYVFDNDLMLVLPLLAMSVCYLVVKLLLYRSVNSVFFEKKKCLQWTDAFLFVTGVEGLLLFPFLLLQVYFGLSFQKATICFLSILFLNKIMTFYKARDVFFREKGGFLQTFLYFCTLEIAPLLVFVGSLQMVVEILKINF